MRCGIPKCSKKADTILSGIAVCKYHSEGKGLEEAQEAILDASMAMLDSFASAFEEDKQPEKES